jgi:hypothetical protein
MKKIFIGMIIGAVLISTFWFWWYKTNPKIVIASETPTITTVYNPPKTDKEAMDCVNSMGVISGEINDKNVFHVVYEDACKRSEKNFFLKSQERRKHMVFIQAVNTFDKNSVANYGVDVSYLYLIYGSVGVGGGLMVNRTSISPHIGVVYSW